MSVVSQESGHLDKQPLAPVNQTPEKKPERQNNKKDAKRKTRTAVDELTAEEREAVTIVFHQFETGLREGTIFTKVRLVHLYSMDHSEQSVVLCLLFLQDYFKTSPWIPTSIITKFYIIMISYAPIPPRQTKSLKMYSQ